MLQLKIFKGPAQVGKVFELKPGKSLILGRSTDADIQLKGTGVSKKHCRLTILPGSLLEVEDLNSSNGTFANGVLIKKHVIKIGDTLGIHDFILQFILDAPKIISMPAPAAVHQFHEPASSGFDGNAALNLEIEAPYEQDMPHISMGYNAQASMPTNQEEALSFADKIYHWLDINVFPLADKISAQVNVRTLLITFFLMWSSFLAFMTAVPFRDEANTRVQEQSVEVARLYARQLVRLNQQAIIDRRYQNLITNLDAFSGATPGLMRALIFDAEKGQTLAPDGMLRQPLPHLWAVKSISKDKEWSEVDANGVAYVSAPIWISADGVNKVAATAFVEFNTLRSQFTMASMFEQVINSLLLSLLFSALLLIFIYRWTEGSIVRVTENIDEAMKKQDTTVVVPVKWAPVAELCEQVSSALGRAGGSGGLASGNLDDNDSSNWATAAANTSIEAAAAFDGALNVSAWNEKMVSIIGIQARQAIGSGLGDCTRDIAVESALRELANDSSSSPWTPQSRNLEVSGVPRKISMVFGNNAYFVSIGDEVS